MEYLNENSGRALGLFLAFLALSLAALVAAWIRGREWGDLSSRRRCGEALTAKEQDALRRSRGGFCIWALASLLLAAISFLSLR